MVGSLDGARQGSPSPQPPAQPAPVEEAPIQTSSPVPPTETLPLTTQAMSSPRSLNQENVDEYGYSLGKSDLNHHEV